MNIKSALVVDDSKMARVSLKRQLEHRGIEVFLADSGEEAIDFLSQNSIDIIFMDCLMPGIDGFEATRQIKSNPGLSAIPIIMSTGKESDEDKQKAFTVGAVGYMSKSSSSEPLNKILDEFDSLEPEPEVEETEAVNSPELEVINSSGSEKINNTTTVSDINDISRIAEQAAIRIFEKVSREQILIAANEHSKDLNKQINILIEDLEKKVILSVKSSLEEVHVYLDNRIETINQNTLPELKNSIIDIVTESVDNNKQLLKQEVEELKTEFKQLDIHTAIDQQFDLHLENNLPVYMSTLLENKGSQALVKSMIQHQLNEQNSNLNELEEIEDLFDSKKASNFSFLNVFSLIFAAGALSISVYLLLALKFHLF